MAFATTLVAVCLIGVIAEAQAYAQWSGQGWNRPFRPYSGGGAWSSAGSGSGFTAGGFPNMGFNLFNPVIRPPMPPLWNFPFNRPQVPSEANNFNSLSSFGLGSVGVGGMNSFTSYGLGAGEPGVVSNGLSFSSMSDGKGSVSFLTTNENGKQQTLISTPETGDKFVVVSPTGMARLAQVKNDLISGINRLLQSFDMPEIPDFPMPKPIVIPPMPKFTMPEFPKFEPIDINKGPSKNSNFKIHSSSSSAVYERVNDGKPKIVVERTSVVNDNGKVKQEHFSYNV